MGVSRCYTRFRLEKLLEKRDTGKSGGDTGLSPRPVGIFRKESRGFSAARFSRYKQYGLVRPLKIVA
jgi:hypothetical protein